MQSIIGAKTAEELFGDLEGVEQGLARQLLASLNVSNASDGILASLVAKTDLASMRVLALDSETLQSRDETLLVQAEDASLQLPPAVISQAAQASGSEDRVVILSFSVGSPEFAASLRRDAQGTEDPDLLQLASRPVSITFRGTDGQAIAMPSLASPLDLHLPDASKDAFCAFWDENQTAWSRKGVERLSDWDGSGLMCRTTHLTVFGAVLETLVNVLRCTTATQIVSAEGFMNMAKSEWLHYTASIITLSALFLFLVLLLHGCRMDRRKFASRYQVESSLLVEQKDSAEKYDHVEEDAEEPASTERQAKPGCCRRAVSSCFANFTWFFSMMFEMPEADLISELMNAKEVMVNKCISSIYAYVSQADWQSIRAAETSIGQSHVEHWEASAMSVTVKDFVHMEEKVNHSRKKAFAAEQFLSSPYLKRVLLLVRAKHPWVVLQFVSLFRSHTIRAALLILKLCSAAAANALFFSGSASTPDSPADCGPPQTLGERLLRATIIGILSACMGDLIIVLLAIVQRRRVIARKRWTAAEKKKQLRRWRRRSYAFWLLWFLDCGLSVTYVLLFLSNVSAGDGSKWIESTGMSLLQDLVLKPLYLALGYGTIASTVLCCNPHIKEKLAGEWSATQEEAETADGSNAHHLQPHTLRIAWEMESFDSKQVDYLARERF